MKEDIIKNGYLSSDYEEPEDPIHPAIREYFEMEEKEGSVVWDKPEMGELRKNMMKKHTKEELEKLEELKKVEKTYRNAIA
jgi:hypothetical protein